MLFKLLVITNEREKTTQSGHVFRCISLLPMQNGQDFWPIVYHSLSVSLSHDPSGKWRRIREPYQTWTSHHLPVCGDWDRPNAYNRRTKVTYLHLLTLLACFLRIKIMGVSGGLSPLLWYSYLYCFQFSLISPNPIYELIHPEIIQLQLFPLQFCPWFRLGSPTSVPLPLDPAVTLECPWPPGMLDQEGIASWPWLQETWTK